MLICNWNGHFADDVLESVDCDIDVMRQRNKHDGRKKKTGKTGFQQLCWVCSFVFICLLHSHSFWKKGRLVVVIFQWHLMTKEDSLLCFIVYMYKFVLETISCCRQALNKFDSNVWHWISATDPLVLHNPLCQIISKYSNAWQSHESETKCGCMVAVV